MRKTKFSKAGTSQKVFRIFNTLFFVLLTAAVILPILDVFLRSVSYNYRVETSGFQTFGWALSDIVVRLKALFTDGPLHLHYVDMAGFAMYGYLFKNRFFLQNFGVSAATTCAVVLLGLFVSSVSAYILVQRNMPGIRLFKWLLIIALIFDAGLVPRFLLMKRLGLVNTLWPIIIPLSFNIFNIMLLRSYFENLPKSLFEAAEMDGCTPVSTFFKIVLPVARAPLAVVGLLLATAAWNEYVGYCMYISDTRLYNLQYCIIDAYYDAFIRPATDFMLPEGTFVGAYIVIGLLPALFICPIFLKNFKPVLCYGCVKE